MTAAAPPLLVTGLPRTGTSWIGKMLEAGGDVVYINEPLNPRHPPGHSPGVLDARVTHQYQYICADNEDAWLPAFRRTVELRYGFGRELRRNHGPYDLARMAKYGRSFTVGRWRGRRAMLDDPFAILAVPWLVRRLGVRAVVLVRHPAAVAGSYRALGWRVRFDGLLGQPELRRDLLGDAADELAAAADSDDELLKCALLWRTVYGVVDRVYRQLPGVTVRRYEDFADRPVEEFADLYAFLGLAFRDRAQRRIVAATSGGGDQRDAHRWTLRFGLSKTAFRPMDSRRAAGSYRQRLSEVDIARVLELTAPVADRFYPPADRFHPPVEPLAGGVAARLAEPA